MDDDDLDDQLLRLSAKMFVAGLFVGAIIMLLLVAAS